MLLKLLYPSQMMKGCYAFVMCLLLVLATREGYGQERTYFEMPPSSGTNSAIIIAGIIGGSWTPTNNTSIAEVITPANIANPSESNYTVLNASNVNIFLAELAGEAWIQPKLNLILSPGTTTYVRIDPISAEGIYLNTLDLLGLLGDAIRAEAYIDADAGNSGTRVQAIVSSKLIVDKDGKYYLAVTPSVNYNSIRVYLRFSSGLLGLALGSTYKMNVYNAFYTSPDCGNSWATDLGEQSGLNISLTDAVVNPGRAVDASTATFSELNTGLVAFGSSVSQTIFFSGFSGTTDEIHALLSIPESWLEVNLFSNIKIQAYNGNTPVGVEQSLASVLTLDVLNLLNLFENEAQIPISFQPGGAFDRVKISVSSFLNVGNNLLGGGLNIHDVQRIPSKPSIQIDDHDEATAMICEGEPVTIEVKDPLSGYTYDWYEDPQGGSIYKAQSISFTEPNLPIGEHKFYALARKDNCGTSSDRMEVTVIVEPKPLAPVVIINSN